MTENATDLLPIYYDLFFPYKPYFEWLNYGGFSKTYFPNREFSFTLQDDIYIRYQSFADVKELMNEMKKKIPHKIDIGAVYNVKPKDHRTATTFQPLEKELVFDIDITDYDDVRSCCDGANICSKCWVLMTIAMKIIDRALREEFGFQHLLWVYSGRRGVHCWVCDESARKFSQTARTAVVEYLSVVKGGSNQVKKVTLGEQIHPTIQESVKIIKQHFPKLMEDQDILGPEQLKNVLALITDGKTHTDLQKALPNIKTVSEKWNVICAWSEKPSESKKMTHFAEEIMLQYCYPRLDVNVSKGVNHLLKSPFCVHPKTGRICVPIDPKNFEGFDPQKVPTINEIVKDFNEIMEGCTGGEGGKPKKAYKKTSLNASVSVFEDFLDKLKSSWKEKNLTHNSYDF